MVKGDETMVASSLIQTTGFDGAQVCRVGYSKHDHHSSAGLFETRLSEPESTGNCM